MRKVINVSLIILILLAIGIGEQILAVQAFSRLENGINDIDKMIEDGVEISSDEFIQHLVELDEYWDKTEPSFCLFVNYKDLKDISYELEKVMANAKKNEVSMFAESLESMRFYVKSCKELVIFSFKNLI